MAPSAAAAKACPFSDASVDFHPFDLPIRTLSTMGTPPGAGLLLARTQLFRGRALRGHQGGVRRLANVLLRECPSATASDRRGRRRVMREGGFTAYSGLSARVPPDHTRIRKLVQGCFGLRRFKAIEPQIREIVTNADRHHHPERRGRFLQANSPTTCRLWCCSSLSAFPTPMSRRSSLGRQPRVVDLGEFVRSGTSAACPQHGRVLAVLPDLVRSAASRSRRRSAR